MARRHGQLVICDIVFAELAPAFATLQQLDSALAKLGITFETVNSSAAFRAGQAFAAYRSNKGSRVHLIPDFLIAAHAEVQANRLASADRGYQRAYFKNLTLLSV